MKKKQLICNQEIKQLLRWRRKKRRKGRPRNT
jgi:hypothetical protein